MAEVLAQHESADEDNEHAGIVYGPVAFKHFAKHMQDIANQLLAEVGSAEVRQEIGNSNSFWIDWLWRLATAQSTEELNRLAWQKTDLRGGYLPSTIRAMSDLHASD